MGELKEKGLLHHDTHREIQEIGIKSFWDAILCKLGHSVSLESAIEQCSEHGVLLTSDEIAWLEKEMNFFSPESIDDDDMDTLNSELCKELTGCDLVDDGLSSYDPPCRIEEETADYSLGNSTFLEATNQDFNEIASNCEVNDDADEQIKTIIETMKMYW